MAIKRKQKEPKAPITQVVTAQTPQFVTFLTDKGVFRSDYTRDQINRMSAADYKTKVLDPLGQFVKFGVPEIKTEIKQFVAQKTKAEIRKELRATELKIKQAELETQIAQLAELRKQTERRKQAEIEAGRVKTESVLQFLAQRLAVQVNCNHRKGGRGPFGVASGEGTDAMYAVIKHRKPNGRWMILCLRCNKEWHEEFNVGGLVVEPETPGFQEASKFPTDNKSSGSGLFIFHGTYKNPKSKTTRSLTAKRKKQ